jgi:hypothetical protein
MRNIFLVVTLFTVLMSVGCGGAEKAASNNSANSVSASSVNAPSDANAQIEMANSQRTVNANGEDPGVAGNMKPLAQPAPENSTFTMTLTDVGTETRTFKDHPVLDKVVKTIKPGSSSIKVHLKNGKVVDVAGEKIPGLKNASIADILAAAGVKPPPSPRPAAPVEGAQDVDPAAAPTKQP